MVSKNLSPTFRVDGRIAIALDALSKSDKGMVEKTVADREHFLSQISKPGRVDLVSESPPLYSLKLNAGLRVIYSQVDEQIVILDIMRQKTLDQYGQQLTTAQRSKVQNRVNLVRSRKSK